MSLKDTGCPISKEIDLQEFFNDFKQENVIECSYYSTYVSSIAIDTTILTTNEAINNQVIDNCSLNNLVCENDKCLWDEIKIVTPRQKSTKKQFKTFEYFQKCLNDYGNISNFLRETNRKSQLSKDLSYNNSRDLIDHVNNTTDDATLILDEILITVLVCKPLKNCENDFSHMNYIKFLKPELRIDLLGSQTLEDILKMIICKNEDSLLGDFSEIMHDWSSCKVYAKEGYKGGFFLIENTFYDIEDGEDMSTPIIRWISKDTERIEQFGLLNKKSMRNVRLIDMKVCVGKPYLYQHLGDCEHFFVFSDVRLINKNDCQDPSTYPIITGKSHYKLIKCQFCETANSEWLVIDCLITPTENTPICDYCLRMLLYDENHKKIENVGDFKVFKFPSFL